METSTYRPPVSLVRGANPRGLDELLEPLVALIDDPRACDADALYIMERISYLATRGLARDGSDLFLKSFATAAIQLFIAEIRHDQPEGETNWWKLAAALGMSPSEAKATFSKNKAD